MVRIEDAGSRLSEVSLWRQTVVNISVGGWTFSLLVCDYNDHNDLLSGLCGARHINRSGLQACCSRLGECPLRVSVSKLGNQHGIELKDLVILSHQGK